MVAGIPEKLEQAAVEGHLTVKQVAQVLGVSQMTIRRWVASGTIPCQRLGGRICFDAQALIFWFKKKDPYIALSRRASASESGTA